MTTHNAYMPIPHTPEQIARDEDRDQRSLLAQRKAYLCSNECTDVLIRADIERQIAYLEKRLWGKELG